MGDVVDAYNEAMNYIARAQASTRSPDSVLGMALSSLKSYMVNSNTLTSLGVVSKDYNEISPISVTLDDGTVTTAYPTGLLKINTDSEKGTTLEESLTSSLTNVKNQLIGTSGALTNVNTQLNASTGSIWKILNDVQYGGKTLANDQISKVDDQISSIEYSAQNLKDQLIGKYQKLAKLLSQLQTTTQLVTAQLATLTIRQK